QPNWMSRHCYTRADSGLVRLSNSRRPACRRSRPRWEFNRMSEQNPNAAARIGAWLMAAPRRMGRGLIWAYRHTLSPLIGFHCRHLPTCSDYADQALQRYGLWAGGWMTLARLLRCHPWGTSGLDFVPDTAPPDARWYRPWRYA